MYNNNYTFNSNTFKKHLETKIITSEFCVLLGLYAYYWIFYQL